MLRNRIICLCFFLVAAAGFSIVSGCGDDDSADPQPQSTAVTMQILAVISDVDDANDVLGGAIVVGDTITGTYTYDTDTEDSNHAATVGDYRHTSSPYGIFLNINGYEFKTDLNDVDFLMELANDHGATPRDNYLLRSYNNAPAGLNVSVDHISWQLDDDTATALDSIDMPTNPPVLADWTSVFGLTISGFQTNNNMNTYMIRGHVAEVSKVN